MKRHTLFIYIAALLTMLSTALPLSAQNKSFTVNRNDGASQKYSYSQGDRLMLSREDSQGKKHADFVEQQVYVGNAVHNIPLTSIESITFDAQATEDEGKTFTVQESGGKIEYDDIIIDFPSGTFNSDAEVSIVEVSANDVAGSSARSKFYKIKLPTTGTKKSLKININSADNTGNIGMVAQSKGWSMHTGITGNYLFPLDFEKESDTFTGIIGPFDDAESEQPWFSVGLMKMTMADAKSGTRAGEDIRRFKAFWPGRDDELAKKAVELLNDYIPKELSNLKELGFELPQITLKYSVEEYDDVTWGDFIYPSYVASNGYIRVKAANIENLMNNLSNVDKNNQLKQTLIHETLHAVDYFTYDPRSAFMSSFSGQYGDEWASFLGEALGSWVEKFTGSMKLGENTYAFALNFMTEFFPHYKFKDVYTAAGYGMGLFIEYLSRKTDNKKIKTLLDYKRNGLSWSSSGKGAKTVREAYNLFLSENKLKFFNSVDYWNFAFDVLKGNIEERANYTKLSDISIVKKKDEYVFYDDINNYGIVAHQLKIDNKLLSDNKDEYIEIGQYEDNIQTKVIFVHKGGELELVKEVKKDDYYLINVDKFLNDNVIALLLVNTRIQNEENTDRIKSFVKVKVFGDAIVKTDPSELTFDADGEDKFLEVITSQPKYKVEKDVDWLKTLAWVDFTVRVTADPNTSSTERKGTLTIYALDANGNQVGQPAKVEVTQKGKGGNTVRDFLEGILNKNAETPYFVDVYFTGTCSYSKRETSDYPGSEYDKTEQGEYKVQRWLSYYLGEPYNPGFKDNLNISFIGKQAKVTEKFERKLENGFEDNYSVDMTIDNIDSERGLITSLNFYCKTGSETSYEEKILKASNIPIGGNGGSAGSQESGTVLNQFKYIKQTGVGGWSGGWPAQKYTKTTHYEYWWVDNSDYWLQISFVPIKY